MSYISSPSEKPSDTSSFPIKCHLKKKKKQMCLISKHGDIYSSHFCELPICPKVAFNSCEDPTAFGYLVSVLQKG